MPSIELMSHFRSDSMTGGRDFELSNECEKGEKDTPQMLDRLCVLQYVQVGEKDNRKRIRVEGYEKVSQRQKRERHQKVAEEIRNLWQLYGI